LPTIYARPIKALTTRIFRIVYFKEKNKEIATSIFLLGHDDVIQKTLDPPQLCRPTKKVQIQTFPIFFNRNYKTFRILRGFEEISTSVGWRVMAGYVLAKIAKNLA